MQTNTKAFIAGFLGLVVAASASAQDRGHRYQEDARPYHVPQQNQYIGPSGERGKSASVSSLFQAMEVETDNPPRFR